MQIKKNSIRNLFLMILIASLSISAIMAIVVFIFGSFGELTWKIFFTTAFVGIYSLTGLCCAALYEKKSYTTIALAGIIASLVSFIIVLISIWSVPYTLDVLKYLQLNVNCFILSVSLAHASLLLLIEPKKGTVATSLSITLVCIAFVATLLLLMINVDFYQRNNEVFGRILGVVAVLDVLGTIVTPILNKLDL